MLTTFISFEYKFYFTFDSTGTLYTCQWSSGSLRITRTDELVWPTKSPKRVTNRKHSDITKTERLITMCPTSICNNLNCLLLMCLGPLWLRLLLESLKKYKPPWTYTEIIQPHEETLCFENHKLIELCELILFGMRKNCINTERGL